MTLSHFVSLLTAIALNANPSTHAIPVALPTIQTPPPVQASPVAPIKKRPESLRVEVSAKSALVADVSSGAVLLAKDAKVQRPIASITKLMTAMVILDQGLNGEGTLTLERGDFQETSFFQAGDTLTRKDAFNVMLIGSVNEIANAFARTFPGGREAFLEAMRVKSEQLGLVSAVFEDASGVDSGSRGSAMDVAMMMRSALGYPEIRDASSVQGMDVKVTGGISGPNGRIVKVKPTNVLLASFLNKAPYQIVAAKTGSLPEAGYCLAQTTKNAEGKQIIAVVLGSPDHFSRFQDIKALTTWTFETYQWNP